MSLFLGKPVPNFDCSTTLGPLNFYKFMDASWTVLFSHPKDYTPVCTTELGTVASLAGEFQKRGVKLIALSCDSVESHMLWKEDINNTEWCGKKRVEFPIIDDTSREIAIKYGMIEPEHKDNTGMPLTCRAVFIIGPDQCLKLSLLYPASTGRNFDEILRVIDSLQLTSNYSLATPANWKVGDDCMIPPSVSNEAAIEKFGSFKTIEVPSGKSYLRMTNIENKN